MKRNQYREEMEQMEKFNRDNPDRRVQMVIDNFEGDYWFERDGKRLDLIAEHEIISWD